MDGEKAWERTGYGKEGELAEVQLNGFRKCSCKDSDQEGVLLLDRRGKSKNSREVHVILAVHWYTKFKCK